MNKRRTNERRANDEGTTKERRTNDQQNDGQTTDKTMNKRRTNDERTTNKRRTNDERTTNKRRRRRTKDDVAIERTLLLTVSDWTLRLAIHKYQMHVGRSLLPLMYVGSVD